MKLVVSINKGFTHTPTPRELIGTDTQLDCSLLAYTTLGHPPSVKSRASAIFGLPCGCRSLTVSRHGDRKIDQSEEKKVARDPSCWDIPTPWVRANPPNRPASAG